MQDHKEIVLQKRLSHSVRYNNMTTLKCVIVSIIAADFLPCSRKLRQEVETQLAFTPKTCVNASDFQYRFFFS